MPVPFDGARLAQRLEAADFSRDQARAVASALGQELTDLNHDLVQQMRLEEYKYKCNEAVAINVELHKGRFSYALTAIRSLIIVNGGAVIGILTFIGNVSNDSFEHAQHVAGALHISMILFIAGLIAGLSCSACAYLSQAAYLEERDTAGWWLNLVAIVVGITGLVLFSIGAIIGVSGFRLPT